MADRIGRNYIGSFKIDNKVFISTSSPTGTLTGLLKFTVFDIKDLQFNRVREIFSATYDSEYFIDPILRVRVIENLNLRDIVSYSPNARALDPSIRGNTYNLVASCRANGLIFFQGINFDVFLKGNTEPIPTDSAFLNVTSIFAIRNLGRIFTERWFNRGTTSVLTFFSSTAVPPVVYEFRINSLQNVNLFQIYRNNQMEETRYIGKDFIAINEFYTAFLVYDTERLSQEIWVYHRNETNSAKGHVILPLNEFQEDITGMLFLHYSDTNSMFVRNLGKWEIFEISEYQLVIDTLNFSERYKGLVNRTLVGRISG